MLSPLLLLVLCLGDGDRVEDFEGPASEAWERVSSTTHPPYNVIERVDDPEQAKSGSQYLHFRTMGGSTALRRSAHHPWPIEPSRPYRASVWVRLSGNRRNAAALSLTWVNAAGDILAEQRSAPRAKADVWTPLVLDIPLSPPGATGVLPGLHFDGTDIRGTCDFDLLELRPVETLEVRPAGRKVALFAPDEYPRFVLHPAGLPAGLHAITATMISSEGRTVTRTATIEVPDRPDVTVDFPSSPPGLYSLRASVDQHDASRRIAVQVALPGQPLDDASAEDNPLPAPAGDPVTTLEARILDSRRPFVPEGGLFEPDGTPKDAYYSLRVVDYLLAGAEPLADPGLFPPDVRVAAFRKGASLGFALWTETGRVRLPLGLNEGVVIQPLTGAPRPLASNEEVVLTPTPTFLLNVDPLLADLRLDVTPAALPLQRNPVRLTLRLSNRSRGDALRGIEVSVDSLPPGWRASRRAVRLDAVPPGAVREESIDLGLQGLDVEGAADLRLGLRFSIRGMEFSIPIVRRLAVASPIRIEPKVTPGKSLSFRVLNSSDRPMTLSIRSRVPGLPERLDLIPDLAPGARSRVFDFPLHETGTVELLVQESGGERAFARLVLPLR